jgi:uncharacterized protein (DUF1501 family)
MSTQSRDDLDPGRRRALRRLSSIAALGMMPGLSLFCEDAEAAPGYKALVCIFLFGGNDANNMIVPTDATGFNNYVTARAPQASGGLALPGAGTPGGILPLANVNYALHPSMPELQALWGQGVVAALFNSGNLVTPFASVAAYNSAVRSAIPASLFSHADQQRQMQTTSLDGFPTTGWAGRIADQLPGMGGSLPVNISAAGNAIYLNGASSAWIAVPQRGTLAYNGFTGSAASNARFASLQSLFAASSASSFASTLGAAQESALGVTNILKPILSGTSPLGTNFPNLATSSLSQQLLQVARLIQAATTGALTGVSRQIFFVDLQGFDTHNDQISRQATLLADLSSSLGAFYTTMQSISQQANVTAFTLSDFARTLKPASGNGSDHAWGSHHLIVGGAVKGSTPTNPGTYGTFPDLVLAGASDVSTEGRWLPTASTDQYAATLGKWFGLSSTQLKTALPNLANFPLADLGFMG